MFIQPEKLSLIEKLSVFRNAKWIAGPQSSAWSNTMFSDHAKGLMITPISWTHDTFVGYNIRNDECDITILPCVEQGFYGSQNDFSVSIEDLIEAYLTVFGK